MIPQIWSINIDKEPQYKNAKKYSKNFFTPTSVIQAWLTMKKFTSKESVQVRLIWNQFWYDTVIL